MVTPLLFSAWMNKVSHTNVQCKQLYTFWLAIEKVLNWKCHISIDANVVKKSPPQDLKEMSVLVCNIYVYDVHCTYMLACSLSANNSSKSSLSTYIYKYIHFFGCVALTNATDILMRDEPSHQEE